MAENTNLSALPANFGPSYLPYKPSLRQKQRALAFFNEKYIHNVKLSLDHNSDISVAARCWRSQRKSGVAHRINLVVNSSQLSLRDAHCNCTAGYE